MMRYEVLYLAGGEEQTDVVEALDAAEAASTVQHEHGRSAESFELLSVNLIDDLESMPIGESGTNSVAAK